ncbi:hypothetical protein IEQ34_006783 [Dendrobium chrysotoxum]|uniref:ABC-2 type transporter transmembrane domain-containing protein n=1 Tax=Dendrobium chrysotoxum TaxID=161865 RepID=A0AAV7H807_DENCH|nr:hypothetical protein IEQ34_006783 [Dendrobium chrysotoxum]
MAPKRHLRRSAPFAVNSSLRDGEPNLQDLGEDFGRIKGIWEHRLKFYTNEYTTFPFNVHGASHIFTNETIIYFPYRFFKQFLIFFIIQQMAAGLLRLVAGITRHMTTANTYGCIFSLLLMSLAGFAIPKGSHLSLSNLVQ